MRMNMQVVRALWLVLMLSMLHAVQGAEQPDERRLALPEAIVAAATGVNGVRPTEEEWFDLLSRQKPPLAPAVSSEAWRLWHAAQKPELTPLQLKAIFAARQAAVRDVYIRYAVRTEMPPGNGGEVREHYRGEYAAKGRKLFLSREDLHQRDPQTGLHPMLRRAYDGAAVRLYTRSPDSGRRATLHAYRGRDEFLDRSSPWWQSMLLRMRPDLDAAWWLCDAVEFMESQVKAIVQETREDVDGVSCLVVLVGTPATWKIYVDPGTGYSIRRFVEYSIHADEKGMPRSRSVDIEKKYEDFARMTDGLWLPRRITIQWFAARAGEAGVPVRQRRTVELLEAAINKGILDNVFEDIFPVDVPITNLLEQQENEDQERPR